VGATQASCGKFLVLETHQLAVGSEKPFHFPDFGETNLEVAPEYEGCATNN
jgi:hypothetical protein